MVPHESAETTEHLALIPLGTLLLPLRNCFRFATYAPTVSATNVQNIYLARMYPQSSFVAVELPQAAAEAVLTAASGGAA